MVVEKWRVVALPGKQGHAVVSLRGDETPGMPGGVGW
jgi:hypothetical protein